MSDLRGRFSPSELDAVLDAESAELLAAARDLEAYAEVGTGHLSADFTDRVMAVIATEPMPRPSVSRGFVAFVRDAWAAAFGAGRPLAVRAQGLALLLLLAVAVGSVGSVVAVGASRLLTPPPTTPPTVIPSPTPSSVPSTPPPSPSPSPIVTPSPTPSETPSQTARPTATATDEPSGTDDNSGPGGGGGSGSDDSGGNSGPGGGGGGSGSDDSGSGSGSGGETHDSTS